MAYKNKLNLDEVLKKGKDSREAIFSIMDAYAPIDIDTQGLKLVREMKGEEVYEKYLSELIKYSETDEVKNARKKFQEIIDNSDKDTEKNLLEIADVFDRTVKYIDDKDKTKLTDENLVKFFDAYRKLAELAEYMEKK